MSETDPLVGSRNGKTTAAGAIDDTLGRKRIPLWHWPDFWQAVWIIAVCYAIQIFWGAEYTSEEVLGMNGGVYFAIAGPLVWAYSLTAVYMLNKYGLVNFMGLPSASFWCYPLPFFIMFYGYALSPIAEELAENVPWWQLFAATAYKMFIEFPFLMHIPRNEAPAWLLNPFLKAPQPYSFKAMGKTFGPFKRGLTVAGIFSVTIGPILAIWAGVGDVPDGIKVAYWVGHIVFLLWLVTLISTNSPQPNLFNIHDPDTPEHLTSSKLFFSKGYLYCVVTSCTAISWMTLAIAIRKLSIE